MPAAGLNEVTRRSGRNNGKPRKLAILRRGIKAWNRWRKENPEVTIDFRRADLTGIDLKGANLEGADIRAANLTGAQLENANLAQANLRRAILRHADCSRANLMGADLSGADLMGARLGGADLRKTNLEQAKFKESQLRHAKLDGAIREYRRSAAPPDVPKQNDPLHDELEQEMSVVSRERSPAVPPGQQARAGVNTVNQKDEVFFTSIHPKEGKVETWHTLLVYAHLPSAIDDVRRDAQRFHDEIALPKETTSPASTRIERGTEITIVPTCDSILFNPERLTIKWIEDYHRGEFRFKADKSLADDAAKGQINFYVGPVLIGTLKFAMLFHEKDEQIATENQESGRMYQQEEIFISYSHKDTDIVLACKKAYQALGFDVLIDADTLRAGQVWNEELMRMIDRATIFQLFWSQNTAQSKYCRQEWEHALKKNAEVFIRPCYWEQPLPQPRKN